MKRFVHEKILINIGVLVVSLMVILPSGISAQKQFKKADAQFSKCNYSQALRLYKKGLNDSKITAATKSEIYSKMAKCYMGMCYYKPARYYFDKVVLLNPDNMANLPLYAEILRCNGQYMEALSQYYKFNNNVDDAVTSNKIFELLSFPIGNNFENPFVGIQGQYAINTFGKKRGLQFINDKLYYSTTGYMIDPLSPDYDNHINDYRIFKSDVTGNVLSNTLPENEIPVFSRNKIVSFALQPGTDALYFVALNKNGESKLYCSQLKEGGYSKKQEVRIGGESVPVESLTFDDDGNRMIFSAYIENAGGCGGNDLWYSVLKDGEWQKPVNMGSMINTRGDEITPFVYHKTLFFSSNGHQENYGGFDIYSVGLSLKKNKVCNLKMPYNSFADDFCLVINPNGDGGFLVSTRDTSILDDKIYGFSHLPNFTFCTGFVSDNNGHHLSDVGLTLYNEKTGKVEYMAKSADNGRYGVFFDNNSMYRLELEKDNYFPMKLFCKSDMDSFYLTNNSKNENIILDGFELNKAYKISDVFHQTADVEVQRTNRLSAVASFIKDNPNLVLYVHLFGYLSSDEDFNEILNKKRIENLKAFLRENGVAENRFRYETYENMLPADFPPIDMIADSTYVLYIVITPNNTKTIMPKTVGYRPYKDKK